VQKFFRVALIVCLVVAAVPILLAGSLWLWSSYKSAEVENFYREHALLNEIRRRQESGTNDSASGRQALFEVVPVGSDREVAIALLRKEGLGCQTIRDPTRKGYIECQFMSPAVLGYTHWIIVLQFDDSDRLTEARVAKWNIFL
jgi:hypothetical protein